MAHRPVAFNRIITTHDHRTGKAVFQKGIDESVPFAGFPVPPGRPTTSDYALAYATTRFPVKGLSPPALVTPEADANLDIKQYMSKLRDPSPLNPDKGTACTVIEVPPKVDIPMHRTESLDYGVVIDGTTELVLDSGETRVLRKGDVFIQRGTAHSWRNITHSEDNNGVLRVFFVFQPIEPVRIGEEELHQDLELSLKPKH
ncbi:hypothetical protein C8Q69DRAFT_251481 [Paecilomyces variotii]|uniref:Cupin type-2 domain-containing protein n=1 Tax=Byssochlamys spectabilis TaxID=264951 RepID=A0A443HUG6_BYSSP|nr:hypothetical protein C8Q69DRAFT_251481 [Paecilomyces variotii]KAH1840907.1 hypothetical protein KXX54_002283 [Aspergillus fumigatus]KAJ9364850.1 hypothetical protein DTO280E4_1145 [Paecilomyces variotii]RWQ95394.1 hypothetical protein C8Q69DRAFT_251481 [Paecilomyces variotii]